MFRAVELLFPGRFINCVVIGVWRWFEPIAWGSRNFILFIVYTPGDTIVGVGCVSRTEHCALCPTLVRSDPCMGVRVGLELSLCLSLPLLGCNIFLYFPFSFFSLAHWSLPKQPIGHAQWPLEPAHYSLISIGL